MTAAPPQVSRNSSVVEMNEDGSMKVLRKGSGEWTCVPDDPSTPGNDPMCLDPNAMEWLHAYATKSAPPDKIGFIYMLSPTVETNTAKNTDRVSSRPECGTTLCSARAILHVHSDALLEMLKESFA
jgi:hypothetical protein